MLVRDFISSATERLIPVYGKPEARAVVTRLIVDMLGIESYSHIINPSLTVPPDKEEPLVAALDRLRRSEPLQYVLGYAEFCGFRFNVNPSVLIPRPETEQLTMMVADEACRDRYPGCTDPSRLRQTERFDGLRIIDLCCGSGCITWSLALLLRGAQVTGIDISSAALKVAVAQPLAAQAQQLGASVPRFVNCDLLSFLDETKIVPAGASTSDALPTQALEEGEFDIIVSNPPYVLNSEKPLMAANVLDYEPPLALFVPDDDPLIFFKAIAKFAKKRLHRGGFALIEINEALCEPTERIFSNSGFHGVSCVEDFRSKMRFIHFQK